MRDKKLVRTTEAARILGLAPSTVRLWARTGKLEYTYSAAGQRVFSVDYLMSVLQGQNSTGEPPGVVFYARTSGGGDILLDTQIAKLEANYGTPVKAFKDKSSGLNDKRVGLRSMLDYVRESDEPLVVYVTNKDRLTRFGFSHVAELLRAYGADVMVLDDDELKEPMEILMQDFMSLIASFSGKFYRMRGWEQQKRLLDVASQEVERNVAQKE